jgi:pimeloyl-ACP methyl ester carboxylesterase
MKVYFISGLAADRRVFKYIELSPGYEPVYIDWISPDLKETLKDYALRLASSINKTEPFVLVGLSLGGMIATEIAKQFAPEKLILISSIPAAHHLPFYFRILGALGIHKIVPVSFLKSASIIKRFFSAETSADKVYLRQAIKESDPAFIKWAINAILKWKGRAFGNCIHIHGNKDLLLPCRYTKPTHVIKGGGHMMILTHGKEINKVLESALNC